MLYKLFGVNAELLIDHAWGWEPTEIADCKAYVPESQSLSSGQVLPRPYKAEKGKLIVREMTDLLSIDLVRKGLLTDQIVLHVGYDIENLSDPKLAKQYKGPIKTDYYGRSVPKSAHGSINLDKPMSSSTRMINAVSQLYDQIVDKRLTVRRFNVAVTHLITVQEYQNRPKAPQQLSLFTDYDALAKQEETDEAELEKERKMQEALISIRDKFGKNAIVKGMNMQEDATAMERNQQIGGHKA